MPALPHLYRNQAADLLNQAAEDILGGADVNLCQNTINNTLNAIKAEAERRPEGPKPKPVIEREPVIEQDIDTEE